jgi:hypothetical protein
MDEGGRGTGEVGIGRVGRGGLVCMAGRELDPPRSDGIEERPVGGAMAACSTWGPALRLVP